MRPLKNWPQERFGDSADYDGMPRQLVQAPIETHLKTLENSKAQVERRKDTKTERQKDGKPGLSQSVLGVLVSSSQRPFPAHLLGFLNV